MGLICSSRTEICTSTCNSCWKVRKLGYFLSFYFLDLPFFFLSFFLFSLLDVFHKPKVHYPQKRFNWCIWNFMNSQTLPQIVCFFSVWAYISNPMFTWDKTGRVCLWNVIAFHQNTKYIFISIKYICKESLLPCCFLCNSYKLVHSNLLILFVKLLFSLTKIAFTLQLSEV